MLAAFDVLLYRYTDQDDVVVGAPVDTRTRSELQEVVGPFINTIVLRNDLSGSPSFKELVGRVHRRTLDAIEHQELPFERLVEALAPDRDLSRHPIFQTLLALNPPEKGLALPGGEVQEIDPCWSASRVDLFLVLDDLPHGLEGDVENPTRKAPHPSRTIRNAIFGRNAARAYNFDPDKRVHEIHCDAVQHLRDNGYLDSPAGGAREAAPLRTNQIPGPRTRREVLKSLTDSPWSP